MCFFVVDVYDAVLVLQRLANTAELALSMACQKCIKTPGLEQAARCKGTTKRTNNKQNNNNNINDDDDDDDVDDDDDDDDDDDNNNNNTSNNNRKNKQTKQQIKNKQRTEQPTK